MYYKDLDLKGGVLRSDGKIIAFAIGEGTTEDTFVVSFCRSVRRDTGAYPMINQQFILHEAWIISLSTERKIWGKKDSGRQNFLTVLRNCWKKAC